MLVLQVANESSQIACSQVHVSTWVAECQWLWHDNGARVFLV